LWKSPQGFNRNNNTKFSTWFFNVVKNRAIDFLKKNREELLSEDFDLEDNSQNQLKLIESNNENRIFKEALKDLEYNQKQAIELFLDENKHKKSAEIMGISTKAYQSLLMRSKKALKIFYEKKLNKFYDKK
jgi:RNA polymerase sigma-70 factor (ECF subfamily)